MIYTKNKLQLNIFCYLNTLTQKLIKLQLILKSISFHWLYLTESENRGRRSVSSPRRIENNRRRGTQSREDCFSAPVDTFIGDFDFEKNLALFDKKAVFQEIENTHPNIIKAAEKKAPTKYKCDENVLHTAPVVFRQIKLPQQNNGDRVEYVTGKFSGDEWDNDRGTHHSWNQNWWGCRSRQFRFTDGKFRGGYATWTSSTMKALL